LPTASAPIVQCPLLVRRSTAVPLSARRLLAGEQTKCSFCAASVPTSTVAAGLGGPTRRIEIESGKQALRLGGIILARCWSPAIQRVAGRLALIHTCSMAKLSSVPITANDLRDFVAHDSDFAFEMAVVRRLRHLQFDCLHSGTYQDPVTGKTRQFDIRAVSKRPFNTLALGVECKNLRPNSPLLLSTVPRMEAEAFHDVIRYNDGAPSFAVVQTVRGDDSAYFAKEMVAKKTDQVGRDEALNTLVSDDSATFDKLSQAINNCRDLAEQCASDKNPPYLRVVAPVLVIPDNLLWQVDYSASGTLMNQPRNVTRATFYLNKTWAVPRPLSPDGPLNYRMSHLEIVTLGGLADAVESWFGVSGFFHGINIH